MLLPVPPALVQSALVAVRQDEPPTVRTEDYAGWNAARLYERGVLLLRRGRQFDETITLLGLAAEREPVNAEYRSALGCAFAARFASVAVALRQQENWQQGDKNYEFLKGEWDKAQKDPVHVAFGAPAPTPPAPPATPDDARRFTRTRDEALRELIRLGRSSVAAFDEARRLSKSAPPVKRAAAEYMQGWGLFLLRRFGKDVVSERSAAAPPGKTVESAHTRVQEAKSVAVSQQDVIACFRHATEDAPENPDNWHALALAHVPSYLSPENGAYFRYFGGEALHDKADTEEAVAAFDKALALKPNRFDLLYQRAVIVAPLDPAEGVDGLEKAARRLGINAVLWYLIADRRFRLAEKQDDNAAEANRTKALSAVGRGNSAPQYADVPVVLPAPPLLAKAWEYGTPFGTGADGVLLQALGADLAARIAVKDKAGEGTAALGAAQLLIDLGLKALGSAQSATGLTPAEPQTRQRLRGRALMGILACYRSFETVKKAQATRPDDAKARFLDEKRELLDYLRPVEERVTSGL